MAQPDPAESYRRRLAARSARVDDLRRRETIFSWSRLGLFVVALILGWWVLVEGSVDLRWLGLPVASFVAVAVAHSGTERRRKSAERAVSYYRRGVARLEHRWAGDGPGGDRFLQGEHPYAGDLDLFGDGSLFQLLCTARSRAGEDVLAGWLLHAAEPEEIARRQQAVEELRGRLDLREELALLGEDARAGVDADDLVDWAVSAPKLPAGWPVRIAVALAAANVVTLLGWMRVFADQLAALIDEQAAVIATGQIELFAGSGPFWVAAVVGAAFARIYRSRAHAVAHAVDRPVRELQLLADLLSRLERERFEAPLLRELRAALDTAGRPPSRRIAWLSRLVQVEESRHNMIFVPLAALLLLGTQLAFALERWRRVSGPGVPRWIDSVARLEALSALAGYAYENPQDPFPEVVSANRGFDARGLGHPLIPRDRCVTNDVRLGGGLDLLLVSGSNMSGKSTLLRCVGINAVLALAGAPVRAASLRLSPFAVGASMRIVDSLQEGTSHFYAELKRLRLIVDLCDGRLPVLFLLDEILHGTNSQDRRVGAEALIRGLLERHALGLVTTHDLALSRIADELEPRAANVHFEDHLEGDRIAFDFKLRTGVVQRGNALALMRAVGLEI